MTSVTATTSVTWYRVAEFGEFQISAGTTGRDRMSDPAIRRRTRRFAEESQLADGLEGEWISVEDLLALEPFNISGRPFKTKINSVFGASPGQPEPGIKAAVKRRFKAGDVICRAGEYGSTAFLLLEGSATEQLPAMAEPRSIKGRTTGSFARIVDMFRRRTSRTAVEPGALEVGEVSRYATMHAGRPAPARKIGPGEVFGIDACMNFYPREATVVADGDCVAIELLRSVLDALRDAQKQKGAIDDSYAAAAIRNQLRLSALVRDLADDELEILASSAELIRPNNVNNNVIYLEGDTADALFLVRAGTIKIYLGTGSGERIISYLGRGAAFGFENILPSRRRQPLVLRCISHPGLIAPVEIRGTMTLGRGDACEVRVPREMSAIGRRHCRFEEQEDQILLVDLESANYTLLNGERILSSTIKSGDRVTIVDCEFEVTRDPIEANTTTLPISRLASAAGLDRFELIKVPVEAIRRVARQNDRFLASISALARTLETSGYRETGGRRETLRDFVDLNLYNSQNTLLIDLERCTRCDECVRACSDAHDGVARFTRDGPRIGKYLVTMACRSCTDPKCMVGCPVGSIRRTDSLEVRIEDWCIGCEKCANQCPFGVINMVERPVQVKVEEEAASPVAVRLKATSCDLCAGYDSPNCVYACPHDAAIRVNPAEFLSATDGR
jgi:Fe-S-cluster-containing hydrogenase component 2/CRP-like cAMP-binding protein